MLPKEPGPVPKKFFFLCHNKKEVRDSDASFTVGLLIDVGNWKRRKGHISGAHDASSSG
jgi:hypothetical protein